MGVGMLLPLLLLGALLVLPESPRWLLSHGFQAAARDVVDMVTGHVYKSVYMYLDDAFIEGCNFSWRRINRVGALF